MAIPVYLQQFKAAGIYRVVFDKSIMLNLNQEILRLVVGYSEQGPFNIPTYVPNIVAFKTLYGEPSKKLEKRGVWFHRMAQQALATGPILCLNLKKFENESVGAATIDTSFCPKFDAIDIERVRVEDIYDTSRFWELSAEKLNDLRTVDGSKLDRYINISTTDTIKGSATFFIRKAVGSVINNYKVSLSDWYSDGSDVMPEYLEDKQNTLVSDYMAEVYAFKSKFTKEQVLASASLKNHFTTDAAGNLVLRKYELNGFGEPVDTLDALYNDETSGAIGHYVGTLIPYMKNKKGQYISLDIVFNEDQHVHNMMMAFNTDMLEDDVPTSIDISGKSNIDDDLLTNICEGDAVVSVLGNVCAEVVADSIKYSNNITDNVSWSIPFGTKATSVFGTMFISEVDREAKLITLSNIDSNFNEDVPFENGIKIQCSLTDETDLNETLNKFNKLNVLGADADLTKWYPNDSATWFGKSVVTSIKNLKPAYKMDGDKYVKDENGNKIIMHYTIDGVIKIATQEIYLTTVINPTFGHAGHTHLHDASLTFGYINEDNWNWGQTLNEDNEPENTFLWTTTKDNSLTSLFAVGDAFIAAAKDVNGFYKQTFITSINTISADEKMYFLDKEGTLYDAMQVEKIVSIYETAKAKARIEAEEAAKAELNPDEGEYWVDYKDAFEQKWNDELLPAFEESWTGMTQDDFTATDYTTINFTIEPLVHEDRADNKATADVNEYDPSHNTDDGSFDKYLVRLNGDLCRENGSAIYPQYLEGYVYENPKPAGADMLSKLNWHNDWILSALTSYKGLRTGLLNKADIDYRYIVDTFESYVDGGIKNTLSFLAKEKQSAFAILNFPSVKTFVKCPYASFTDEKGVFNVQYIVDGYNKKKAHSKGFSLPSDDEGASFCAFYSPLKFSDGYVDSIVPSAALVSNLFMQKYMSRKPYYIIAGPTYGVISASGLVGPDYNYSQEELHIIEPYGVNCMVYRPNFGTFINANQTAKQTPVSALSRVNVRELVIYLQDEIEKVLQSYQWEFNNSATRNAILSKANTICANIQSNGGIQAFVNIMDETNNTPEIIDNEMAILSTHIEPGFGCGKMVHELTLYKTGGLSSATFD
jgi:hypothetical protein